MFLAGEEPGNAHGLRAPSMPANKKPGPEPCAGESLRMKPIANIWQHPRTSVAGLLISIATISGVLAQQGVTLGKAGSGTVVSLAGALATAVLGLLAKDPGQSGPQQSPAKSSSASSSTAKLGAWMLIALLLPLPWLEGCSGKSVAQDIVNWTPSLESAVATVDSTASLLAPADAPVFTAATSGFDAASSLLVAQARAYLANPTASALTQLQAQVVALQQQVNAALLSASRIVDAASQQHAIAALQAVATIVSAILSLVQSISSKAQVAQMAARSTVKLSAVAPYLDRSRAVQLVAAHYAEPAAAAEAQVARAEQAERQAGF
jgi:hypothetical protein